MSKEKEDILEGFQSMETRHCQVYFTDYKKECDQGDYDKDISLLEYEKTTASAARKKIIDDIISQRKSGKVTTCKNKYTGWIELNSSSERDLNHPDKISSPSMKKRNKNMGDPYNWAFCYKDMKNDTNFQSAYAYFENNKRDYDYVRFTPYKTPIDANKQPHLARINIKEFQQSDTSVCNDNMVEPDYPQYPQGLLRFTVDKNSKITDIRYITYPSSSQRFANDSRYMKVNSLSTPNSVDFFNAFFTYSINIAEGKTKIIPKPFNYRVYYLYKDAKCNRIRGNTITSTNVPDSSFIKTASSAGIIASKVVDVTVKETYYPHLKCPTVTLYEHTNYKGRAWSVGVGNWPWPPPFANDTISSIRVPSGMRVELYEHANYKGKVVVFTGDNPNFTQIYMNPSNRRQGTFNDRASSIKVSCVKPTITDYSRPATRNVVKQQTIPITDMYVGTIRHDKKHLILKNTTGEDVMNHLNQRESALLGEYYRWTREAEKALRTAWAMLAIAIALTASLFGFWYGIIFWGLFYHYMRLHNKYRATAAKYYDEYMVIVRYKAEININKGPVSLRVLQQLIGAPITNILRDYTPAFKSDENTVYVDVTPVAKSITAPRAFQPTPMNVDYKETKFMNVVQSSVPKPACDSKDLGKVWLYADSNYGRFTGTITLNGASVDVSNGLGPGVYKLSGVNVIREIELGPGTRVIISNKANSSVNYDNTSCATARRKFTLNSAFSGVSASPDTCTVNYLGNYKCYVTTISVEKLDTT